MVKFYDRIEFSTLNYIEIVTILEASVFYNRLTHKRVFYGYCKLVAQNFSTREIDFGYYFFQTAYYISKLILPRIVRNLHFWKILFSSMYLDESETP